jgi:hypothetical protein
MSFVNNPTHQKSAINNFSSSIALCIKMPLQNGKKFKFEPRTMALKNKLAKIIKFKKLPQLWNLNIFNTHGCKE